MSITDGMGLHVDLSLREILVAEAGIDAVYVVDAESADRASDYEPHLVELDRISGGALRMRGCRVTEGDPREVIVLRDARPEIVLTLAEENGWVDSRALARQLSEALEREGATSSGWYAFWSRDFRQEIGFAYLPKETGQRIAELVEVRTEHEIFETFGSPTGG